MHISRRAMLRGASLLVPVAALAGCATAQEAATVTADIANEVQAIGTQVAAVLSAAGLASAGAIAADVSALSSAASAVVAGLAVTAAQPFVTQVVTAYNQLVKDIGTVTLPSVATILSAAQTLLPEIETAVGLVVALTAPRSGMRTMSRAQARTALGLGA